MELQDLKQDNGDLGSCGRERESGYPDRSLWAMLEGELQVIACFILKGLIKVMPCSKVGKMGKAVLRSIGRRGRNRAKSFTGG